MPHEPALRSATRFAGDPVTGRGGQRRENGEPAASGAHDRAGARPFSLALRVYHEDTDGSGAVYHAGYLRFMERARTEWLRALGFEQPDLDTRFGIAFVVRSLAIEYLAPARFNDELAVSVALEALKGGQLVVAQAVSRADRVLATARVRIACITTASFRPVRIPVGVTEVLARCAVSRFDSEEPG